MCLLRGQHRITVDAIKPGMAERAMMCLEVSPFPQEMWTEPATYQTELCWIGTVVPLQRRYRHPVQKPATQHVSPGASVQGVVAGANGLEHDPLVWLQVPARWQSSVAAQVTGFPPVHAPA